MVRITTPVDEATKPNVFAEGRAFVDQRPYLTLRRETSTDRFGKRHGLNREIALGDLYFDAAIYVETNSSEANVRRTLADSRVRDAVRELLDSGVRSVVLGPKGLSTERPVHSAQGPGYLLDRTMELLADIAAALPLFKTGRADKPRWLFEAVGAIGLFAATIGLIALSVPSPLGHNAMLVGFGSGLALWAMLMPLTFKLLRGRSDSLRRIATVAVTTLFLLPFASFEILCWANRSYDKSPGIDNPSKIVRAWTTRPKSRTYYHIELAPLRRGEVEVSLDVSETFFKKATVGRNIVVTTHAGRFGWEWVESFYLTK
jgi:hypothetical protein